MNEANETTNPKSRLLSCLCFGGALVMWVLMLPWYLFTMPQRKRAAVAQEVALREEQQSIERKKLEAQAKRKNEIARKSEALLTLEERYDFATGTARQSGKPADADAIEKAWIKYESLLNELGRSLSPRPYETKTDQGLWDMIGGEMEDTHRSLLFLTDEQDEIAREAAAVALIQMRRELQPLRSVDEHVKAVAELAGRLQLLNTRFHAEESPRRTKALRLIERRLRWRLYRKTRMETQRGRRASNSPSLGM